MHEYWNCHSEGFNPKNLSNKVLKLKFQKGQMFRFAQHDNAKIIQQFRLFSNSG
jgi:hypothetical protein